MPNEKTEKTESEPKKVLAGSAGVTYRQYQEKPKRDFPLYWTVAGAVLFIGGIVGYKYTLKPHVDFGATRVVIEEAKTSEQQAQGLSGRTSLAKDHGMLFVYNSDVKPKFWMKDMKFPLDFIWLSSDGTVEQINQNVQPSTYPKTYSPTKPIRYVLEVNAGFVGQHHITQSSHANIKL
jgi:uncharacterized membrane protein (UPF0127 family)